MNRSNEYEFLQEIFDRVGNHLLTQKAVTVLIEAAQK